MRAHIEGPGVFLPEVLAVYVWTTDEPVMEAAPLRGLVLQVEEPSCLVDRRSREPGTGALERERR